MAIPSRTNVKVVNDNNMRAVSTEGKKGLDIDPSQYLQQSQKRCRPGRVRQVLVRCERAGQWQRCDDCATPSSSSSGWRDANEQGGDDVMIVSRRRRPGRVRCKRTGWRQRDNRNIYPRCSLVKLNCTRARQLKGLDKSVIPVEAASKVFRTKCKSPDGKSITRTVCQRQFSMTAAYAFTDYRAQGQTFL